MTNTFATDIVWTLKLSYGPDYEDPKNKVPVLIADQVFENLSKDKTYFISLWNDEFIESISPRSAFKTFQPNSLGMRSGPRKEDLLELKPGHSHKTKRWYWAEGNLPWTNSNRTEGFEIEKPQDIEIQFCRLFSDDSEIFKRMLALKDLTLNSGRLCSKKTKLNFKIYTSSDEE